MYPLGLLRYGAGDVVIELVLVVIASRKRLSTIEHNALPFEEVAAGGKLDEAVEVDGHHRLGTRGNRSRAHRILVGGVVVGRV